MIISRAVLIFALQAATLVGQPMTTILEPEILACGVKLNHAVLWPNVSLADQQKVEESFLTFFNVFRAELVANLGSCKGITPAAIAVIKPVEPQLAEIRLWLGQKQVTLDVVALSATKEALEARARKDAREIIRLLGGNLIAKSQRAI